MWNENDRKMGVIGMRIAVPAVEDKAEGSISPVFARAQYFAVAEIENGEIKNWNSVKNPAVNERGGAGILAARMLAEQGVEAVIVISLGPRAFQVLKASGIKIYQGRHGSVKENAEAFARGELQEFAAPIRGFGTGHGFGWGRRW